MEMLTKEDKKKITDRLAERKALAPCPRCNQTNFAVLEGYLVNSLQTQLDGTIIGGPFLPTVGIVCTNCGYLSQHAIGVLGLQTLREGNHDKKE